MVDPVDAAPRVREVELTCVELTCAHRPHARPVAKRIRRDEHVQCSKGARLLYDHVFTTRATRGPDHRRRG